MCSDAFLQLECYSRRQQCQREKKALLGLTTLRPPVVNCFAASIPHRWVSECWTEFPFPRCLRTRRVSTRELTILRAARPFQGGFPRGLGPTNPCPSTVHMETDSASIFCVLHRIIATTTKICTGCAVHVSSRYTLLPAPHALLHRCGLDLPQAGGLSETDLSIVHFRGWCSRQVSCYTLLSRFLLPWPRPCCLPTPTPFNGVCLSQCLGSLSSLSVHPASPILLTKNGPHGNLIRVLASRKKARLRAHLEFENKLRQKMPQFF